MRIWLGICLALGLAAPAAATPPDVANVRDELIGSNDARIFVLRTTYDNTGSHYESRNEVFLVAIDLETAAEEYWPLYRVTQTTDFGEDGAGDQIVIRPDEGADASNPYTILAKEYALPWSDSGPQWNAPVIESNTAALTIRYGGDQAYILSAKDQSDRLTSSVQTISSNITNYPRMSSLDTKQIFTDLDQGLEHCQFTDPVRLYSRSGGVWHQLIRMNCGDYEEGMGGTSLIVPVPAAAKD